MKARVHGAKVVSGVYAPDHGEIRIDSKVVRFDSPAAAKRHGIETLLSGAARMSRSELKPARSSVEVRFRPGPSDWP